MWLYASILAGVVAGPSPSIDDVRVQVRVLLELADSNMAAANLECREDEVDPAKPGNRVVGAKLAEEAANLHIMRGRLIADIGASPQDLAHIAQLATEALKLAAQCDPTRAYAYYGRARNILFVALDAWPTEEAPEARSLLLLQATTVDRAVEALRPKKSAPESHAALFGCTPVPDVDCTAALERSANAVGRIALRFEVGSGFGSYGKNGFAGRVQLLARFVSKSRPRVVGLFGPYYSIMPLQDTAASFNQVGDRIGHGFGIHAELQWTPAAKLDPWLSLHPSLHVGLESWYEKIDGRWRTNVVTSGLQVGGGMAVCLWHASVCPSVRLMNVPAPDYNASRPTVTIGLMLDPLRWVEHAVAKRHKVAKTPAKGQTRPRQRR